MPISIYRVALEVQHAVMSLGVKVDVDETTDNLLVTYGDRGFAITRNAIDDFSRDKILADAKEAACDLVLGSPATPNATFFSGEKITERTTDLLTPKEKPLPVSRKGSSAS